MAIFVDSSREAYKTELSRDVLHLEALENLPQYFRWIMFSKPCQIDVFEFISFSRVLWIVRFEKNKPDKDFKVVEMIKESPEDFVRTHDEYKKYSTAFEWAGYGKEDFLYFSEETPRLYINFYYMAVLFLSNPREKIRPSDLALQMFYERRLDVMRSVQRSRIEKSASLILSKAKELSKAKASPTLIEATRSIEDALKKLMKIDEHERKLMSMEEDIKDFRTLVGRSKDFQFFKAFTADIKFLKQTHVNKEVFLSEIKRVEDKINGLNIRIEDLKAIKLWSKRTVLEMVLAIWGAIITLYAAGLLKF